jgi:hypothetical protein
LAIIARRRRGRIAGWTLAILLGLAAVAAYGLALWRAPDWVHAAKPQDRYNARVLVISVGGAIVVGAGLLYTARNYRLSRRRQVTERFAFALDRLGSSELYARIGGVRALEDVIHDSAGQHYDVIEVLNPFIRAGTPRRARQSDPQVWMHPVTGSDPPSEPAADIQAALTVLAYRPLRPERQVIDLRGLHLANAYLTGANLTRANFFRADLTRANFTRADLTGASFTGADLTGAWLSGADVTRANFTGADLTGADLTRADLTGADLTGASFTGADLTGAWRPPAPAWRADQLARGEVPEGWQRDGWRLKRAETGPGGEAAM